MSSWVRSALLVTVSVSLATVLTWPLRDITVHSRSLLFVAAVIVTSRFGRVRDGIVTALASVLIFDWFFDNHPYRFDLDLAGLVRAAVFLALSIFVASLESQRRTALGSLAEINRNLQAALDEVKQLRGILPICMYCKQIRNDEGAWVRLEQYIQSHSEAEFSHGVCPDCFREHHPEIYRATHPDP